MLVIPLSSNGLRYAQPVKICLKNDCGTVTPVKNVSTLQIIHFLQQVMKSKCHQAKDAWHVFIHHQKRMLTSETTGPILKPNALQTSPRLERLDALTKWSESFVPTRKAFNNIALYGGTRSPANIKQIYAKAILSPRKTAWLKSWLYHKTQQKTMSFYKLCLGNVTEMLNFFHIQMHGDVQFNVTLTCIWKILY